MSEAPSKMSTERYSRDRDDLSDAPPFGWILYTHPEGARYFVHEEKVGMT